MVRAAGEIHCDPSIQRRTCRFARPPSRTIRPLDQRLRPGESESSFLIGRQRSAREAVDVVGRVNQQQVIE